MTVRPNEALTLHTVNPLAARRRASWLRRNGRPLAADNYRRLASKMENEARKLAKAAARRG